MEMHLKNRNYTLNAVRLLPLDVSNESEYV